MVPSVGSSTCLSGKLQALWFDESGQAVRHYVLAVAAGAITAIVVCTVLADRIYDGMKHTFGP